MSSWCRVTALQKLTSASARKCRARMDATYAEHAKILEAIQHKRGDQAALLLRSPIQTSQAEVRKITLHQVHMGRQAVC